MTNDLAAVYGLYTMDGVLTVDTAEGTVRLGTQAGWLRGATATVDSAGAISSSVTVGRVLALGVLALAAQKQDDRRELYILVQGPEFSIVAPVHPGAGEEARRFAAGVNMAARGGQIAAGSMPTEYAQRLAWGDKAGAESIRRSTMTPAQLRSLQLRKVLAVVIVLVAVVAIALAAILSQ